jgi:hypothetical protein
MKFGFVMPFGTARDAAELAKLAEQAGWDGFFMWEPVWGVDAWVSMTAAAMVTEKIKLGTLLSPISRMRPWDMAGKAATLDHLSNGRVIISVGMGAIDTGFEDFGEVTDRKTRAELIDEGLDIMHGLWKGQPFTYDGKHYHVKEVKFPQVPPKPINNERVPIWMVGVIDKPKSMRRVLKCDGLLATKLPPVVTEPIAHPLHTPDELRETIAWVKANRTETTPFDFIMEAPFGVDPAKEAEIMAPWQEAGATWWIDSMWMAENNDEGRRKVRERIELGPVRG